MPRDKVAALRARAVAFMIATKKRAAAVGGGLVRWRAELLQSVALLAGWTLLTHGLRSVLPQRVDLWSFSIGLLLLSLCGWRFLYVLFRDGMYKITRPAARP